MSCYFTSKALREKRAPLVAEIRRLADLSAKENRDFTAEEREVWERVNREYNALTQQITQVERAEQVAAEQATIAEESRPIGRGDLGGRGADAEQMRALALQAWCTYRPGRPLPERQERACQALGFNPGAQEIEVPLYSGPVYSIFRREFVRCPRDGARRLSDFRATLSIGSPAGGGYLIPPETMVRQLEINLLAFGGVRQAAETIRTASGEPLSWPTADDTSNTGAQLGESTSIGSSVDPSFGKVRWDAYKFSSKPILVPNELLEDSAIDLPGILGDMLGERLGRITNTKFTTGTGAATPKGIVTAAASFSAASATAIAWDDVLGLEHSIDPAYRTNTAYMMHDSILLAARKLKDSHGQYLWQNGIEVGAPDRFNGKPLFINQDMDSTIASGKKTILYGQLSSYKIRTVGTMRLYRLTERYRDTDQEAFIAFIREDGNLLTSGTARVKVLTH